MYKGITLLETLIVLFILSSKQSQKLEVVPKSLSCEKLEVFTRNYLVYSFTRLLAYL